MKLSTIVGIITVCTSSSIQLMGMASISKVNKRTRDATHRLNLSEIVTIYPDLEMKNGIKVCFSPKESIGTLIRRYMQKQNNFSKRCDVHLSYTDWNGEKRYFGVKEQCSEFHMLKQNDQEYFSLNAEKNQPLVVYKN